MPLPRSASPIGTAQLEWSYPVNYQTGFCTNADAQPAAGDYAHLVTPPTTDFDNGVFWVRPSAACNQIILSYFGSDGDGETFTADIYGVRPLAVCSRDGQKIDEYTGHYFGRHTITLGSGAINASSLVLPTASGLWGDTITLTTDDARAGWEVFADSANGSALVMGDLVGSLGLIVVLSSNGGTAAGMGFLWSEV